jgi:hypothetical protein
MEVDVELVRVLWSEDCYALLRFGHAIRLTTPLFGVVRRVEMPVTGCRWKCAVHVWYVDYCDDLLLLMLCWWRWIPQFFIECLPCSHNMQ